MPKASYQQPNFLGGEWSPVFQGRTDNPRYKTAMNLSSNGFPTEEGAWTKRSGFRWLDAAHYGAASRMFPFSVNEDTPFEVELSFNTARIRAGDKLVLDSGAQLLAISAGSPIQIAVDGGGAAWVTGDTVTLTPNAGTPAQTYGGLANQTLMLTKISLQVYTLSDPVTGNPINGDQLNLSAGGGAQIGRVLVLVTPYTASDWYGVKTTMVGSTMFFWHKNYPPQLLTMNGQPAGISTSFSWSQPQFIDGPYLPQVGNGTDTGQSINVWTGYGTTTLNASDLTNGFGPNQPSGITANDVGRSIRIISEPQPWVVSTSYPIGTAVTLESESGNQYYRSIAVAPAGNNPNLHPNLWALDPELVFWAWGVVATVADAGTFTVSMVTQMQYNIPNPILSFQVGLFGDPVYGYPTCGVFHEGRLWAFGGTTISGSSTVDATGLTWSPTLVDETVTDSSGISYALEAGDDSSSTILWSISHQAGIVLGTNGGEWVVQASALNDPITPTSIQAHRVTKYRCSYVKPVQTPLAIVFVQRFQRKIMEFLQDVFTQRFVAPNLTTAAKHLTTAGVDEVVYQEETTPVLWVRNLNGALNGVTYRRQSSFPSEEPIFTGWHRHSHGQPGYEFSSLCMSPNGVTNLDSLYTLTSYLATPGTYRVERMVKQFDIGDIFASGFFLDAGVVPNAMVDTGTGVTIYGAYAHASKTAHVVLGGVDMGAFAVDSDGRVTVPYTTTVTAAYLQSLNGLALGETGTPIVFTTNTTPARAATPYTIGNYTTSYTQSGGSTPSNPTAAADFTNNLLGTVSGTLSTTHWNITTFNLTTRAKNAQVTGSSLFTTPNGAYGVCFSGGHLMLQLENDQTDVLQKLNATTLASIATMGTTTNAPSTLVNNLVQSAGFVAFTRGTDNLLFTMGSAAATLNAGVSQMVDTDAMTTIGVGGGGPVVGGASIGTCYTAGAAGRGVVFILEASATTLLTLKAASVATDLSAFSILALGTIAPSAIDAAWTHAIPVSVGYDTSDGNLVAYISTTDSVSHTDYFVKIDSANGAVLWATPIAVSNFEPLLNQSRIAGTVAQFDASGLTMHTYLTSTGALLSTTTTSNAGMPAGAIAMPIIDSLTGFLYNPANYNSATSGAPTQLSGTPGTFDEWAVLQVGNELVGPSQILTTYTVPAIVGFDYSPTTQGQLLRPGSAQEAGAANGPPQGKKRRTNQFAALFQNSQAVSIGTDFTHMNAVTFAYPGGAPYTVTQLFSGTVWDTLSDDFSYDSMLAWQSTGPYPLTIVSISGFLETQDY